MQRWTHMKSAQANKKKKLQNVEYSFHLQAIDYRNREANLHLLREDGWQESSIKMDLEREVTDHQQSQRGKPF